MKKAISVLLVLVMAIGICIPAYAGGSACETLWNDYYGYSKEYSLWGEIAPGETQTVSSVGFDYDIVVKMTADKEGFYIFNFAKSDIDKSENECCVYVSDVSDTCRNENIYGTRDSCALESSESYYRSYYIQANETVYILLENSDDSGKDFIADMTVECLGTVDSVTCSEDILLLKEYFDHKDYYFLHVDVNFSEGETLFTDIYIYPDNLVVGKNEFTYRFDSEDVERRIELDVHSVSEFIQKVELPEGFTPTKHYSYRDSLFYGTYPEYVIITDANGNKNNYSNGSSISINGKKYTVDFEPPMHPAGTSYNYGYEFSSSFTVSVGGILYEFKPKAVNASLEENFRLYKYDINYSFKSIGRDLTSEFYSPSEKFIYVGWDLIDIFSNTALFIVFLIFR